MNWRREAWRGGFLLFLLAAITLNTLTTCSVSDWLNVHIRVLKYSAYTVVLHTFLWKVKYVYLCIWAIKSNGNDVIKLFFLSCLTLMMMIMMVMMMMMMTESIVNAVCIQRNGRPAYITEAPLSFGRVKLIHLKVLVTYFFKCTLNERGHNSSVQKGRVRVTPFTRNK